MGVNQNYKETDVGSIPKDWDVVPIGDLFTFKNGLNKAKEFFGHGTPIINYMDVFGKTSLRSEDIAGKVEVSPKEISAYNVKNGDVFFTRTSETTEEIGLASVALEAPENAVYSGFVLRARSKDQSLDNQFKAFCFSPRYFRSQIISQASYTTRALTNGRSLSRALLVRPPIGEQRAIATALSDADTLIASLEKLIAKKRDIKQAAMQQLLTGQTRLPGFSGRWGVSRLKDVAAITAGINKPLSELGSGALYVTVQDLYDGTSIRTSRLGRINVSSAEIEAKSLAAGDIVFGKSSVKREGIGFPSIFLGANEPAVFSGFTYRARARDGVCNPKFLFYALRSEKTRRWVIDNSQASALTNINQKIADSIPIELPESVAEQESIVEALSGMDAELDALESRLVKTRAIKHGMMQELLTGRTRLV